VAAEVVANREFDVVVQGVEVAKHVQDGTAAELRIGLGDGVEVRDIGGMVPVMVDFHSLGVDVGLERVGWIGQRREHEGAGRGRSGGCLGKYSAWCGGGGSDACGHRDEMATGYCGHKSSPWAVASMRCSVGT
jgi:hypothetical protein